MKSTGFGSALKKIPSNPIAKPQPVDKQRNSLRKSVTQKIPTEITNIKPIKKQPSTNSDFLKPDTPSKDRSTSNNSKRERDSP